MNRRKRRSQLDTIDEINMTPLMDLTFLLLIIFMIATPLLEYSIDVSPPEMNADKIEDKPSETINLLANGRINYKGRIVSRDELLMILGNLKATAPKTVLFLRADGDIPYRKVIELMKEIKNSGFSDISLITTAETK
ncbi:MAG: biopolymer transporter ExbD [Victivallaceae bacterium]|nr:biopolymer transporter ExbD [Victivallaceae bacterium]